MEEFTINEMLELQRKFQKEYNRWSSICPENGKNKLLWMVGEIGEVIDIVKKNGSQPVVENAELRAHFVEELADVLIRKRIFL